MDKRNGNENIIKRAINTLRATRAMNYCSRNRLKLAAEFEKCTPEVLECNLTPMLEGVLSVFGGPMSSCRLKYGNMEVFVEFQYTQRFRAYGNDIAQIVGKGIPVEYLADSWNRLDDIFYPTFQAYDSCGAPVLVRVLSAKF